MVTLFIVVANEVLQCFGNRYCDSFNAVVFTKMWEMGLVEVMFEGYGIRIYRKTKEKLSKEYLKDRLDKVI